MGPAVLVHAIYDRLTQQARAVANARPSNPGASLGPAASRAEDRAVDAGGAAVSHPDEVMGDGGNPVGSTAAAPDDRTLNQLRADILADMLLAGAPQADPTGEASLGLGGLGAIRANVHVRVPALALAGITAEPRRTRRPLPH